MKIKACQLTRTNFPQKNIEGGSLGIKYGIPPWEMVKAYNNIKSLRFKKLKLITIVGCACMGVGLAKCFRLAQDRERGMNFYEVLFAFF